MGNGSQGVREKMFVSFVSIRQTRICFKDQRKATNPDDTREKESYLSKIPS